MKFLKRTWCEIDLSSLHYNIQLVRDTAQKAVMAIVKANAYGHGDKQVARTCQQAGIQHFGVSNLNEALMLRKYGITGEILILGYTDPDCAKLLARHHISQTVFDLAYATALSAAATAPISVHLKLDTGMGRLGFDPEELQPLVAVSQLPQLQLDGIFSHFSCADSDTPADIDYTKAQIDRFDGCVQQLSTYGITPRLIHLQNSAGIFNYPSKTANLVRAGIVLYGYNPSDALVQAPLRPILTLKTVVQQCKIKDSGASVSYGRTFQATSPRRIAAVAVGYADGYPRLLSNRGQVLIQGVRCPIVGRICMDQMMVDVTDLPTPVEMGQEVTLIGCDGDQTILIEELAGLCDTIHYELTCDIARRVPRVYYRDGAMVDVIDDSLHLSL